MFRTEIHAHTDYSNIRLIDSTNKVDMLVNYAESIGLKGIAITDHECLCSHIKLVKLQKSIAEKNPDFKIILGNEIYLCDTRDKNQKYYHFILLAKDSEGHRQLRELSSRAWLNSFYDRRMERVVTLKSDIEEIVKGGHVIATTACLGGELSSLTLDLIVSEKVENQEGVRQAHNKIVNFMSWCKKVFNDDFYIECAPGCSRDQILVNQRLVSIAKAFNVKMVIGTDAHYLTKEHRYVHEKYLNSKGGEREVASFYEYAYLQKEEEIFKHLHLSSYEKDFIEEMFNNSMEIYDKVLGYSILHTQQIPKVEVKNHPQSHLIHDVSEYPTLNSMLVSENKIERYWINECLNKLKEIDKFNDTYLSELEDEADVKRTIGEKLNTNMFSYPILLQHYMDLIWECGSPVGVGRGSACSALNHYLLGITQLDSIEWNFPFFRYMNKERTEIGDIDIDVASTKRPLIIQKIKEERGKNFNEYIDELSRDNLGCTLVATFGTETSKSTVLTSCRGYRSEECPDGIDVDTAQYLSSLVPVERGKAWSIEDVVYGNEEKNRKPVLLFVNEIEKYPGLLDIMLGIQNLINKRSSHASGLICFDEDPYAHCCFMRTPKGEVITQYDLHDAEAAGLTKLDILVTEVQDKIMKTLELLQEHGYIEHKLTLRQAYNKYLHPDVLPLDNKDVWNTIQSANLIDLFQLDSDIGRQGTKKILPTNMQELSATNGLIRLMTDAGQETPMEKYIRFKANPSLVQLEMEKFGLTKQEQMTIYPYIKDTYGIGISQEQLMLVLMDENICNFSLNAANKARKTVAKKQVEKIEELKEEVFKSAKSTGLAQYIWTNIAGPQMGYSFSDIHAMSYSFIGFQTAYIATKWNPIFWNTACLIVNSGALDEDADKSSDYSKIAKAIGNIISGGTKVSTVDINSSSFSFVPDIKNNQILYGLKALNGIGQNVIEEIINNRPYNNFIDFLNKCSLNKSAIISLIKGGAFDNLDVSWCDIKAHPRMVTMAYYLMQTSEPKKRLTLQNFNGLIGHGLVPSSLQKQKDIFKLNKFFKKFRKWNEYYVFEEGSMKMYMHYYDADNIETVNGNFCILQKTWDNIYSKEMNVAREWINKNKTQLLNEYNNILFENEWNKYAKGNLSSWEMESLGFYYHEHELLEVNLTKYGIVDFYRLPQNPPVEKTFKRNGIDIPIFYTYKIAGTVLAKNDIRHSISLLTLNGVVNVKFSRDYYSLYNRQISEDQEDGKRKIVDKSWFKRGTMLLLTGFRRDDTFNTKSYSHTPTHQLYKITDITNGELTLEHEREGAV